MSYRKLFHSGEYRNIWCMVNASGLPVIARDLAKIKKKRQDDFDQIAASIEVLGDTAVAEDVPDLRHRKDKVWGLSPTSQARVACFQDGADWVLCAVWIKKRDDWTADQIKQFKAMRADYFRRKADYGKRI